MKFSNVIGSALKTLIWGAPCVGIILLVNRFFHTDFDYWYGFLAGFFISWGLDSMAKEPSDDTD